MLSMMEEKTMSYHFIWIALLILIVGYYTFSFFRQRAFLNVLTQEQFIEGYRKAQLIDVREQQEFERGHIWGARNLPLSQLKQTYTAIRPDKPVYLYCQNSGRSARAANILRKHNYEDVNVLKGGFKRWTGRIKHNK